MQGSNHASQRGPPRDVTGVVWISRFLQIVGVAFCISQASIAASLFHSDHTKSCSNGRPGGGGVGVDMQLTSGPDIIRTYAVLKNPSPSCMAACCPNATCPQKNFKRTLHPKPLTLNP